VRIAPACRTFGVPSVAILVDATWRPAWPAGQPVAGQRVRGHSWTRAARRDAQPRAAAREGWITCTTPPGSTCSTSPQRAAAAGPDLLTRIRLLFRRRPGCGVPAYTDPHHERGRITIADRDIELHYNGGEPYDQPWQGPHRTVLPTAAEDCGPCWQPGRIARRYRNEPDDEAVCASCDDTLFVG